MRKKVNKVEVFGLKLTRRENHMYEECYRILESQKVKNVLKPKTVVNFLKKSKLKNVSFFLLQKLIYKIEHTKTIMGIDCLEGNQKSQEGINF